MTASEIVFDGPGQVAVRDQEAEPPGDGDVVVETECSLISAGTETSVLHRSHGDGSAWGGMQVFPFKPGYSNVGVVVDAGASARDWIGTRVSTHARHASYPRWAAGDVRRVPDGVPSATATLCTLAEVALNAIRRSPAGIGSRCAVLGLGLVGQIAARFLAVGGASVVHAYDPDPRRTALVPERAAFRVDGEPPAEEFDVVVEASGHPSAMEQAGRLTRVGGTIALVSSPSGPTTFDFHDACNRKSVTIVGSHYFSHPPAGRRWDARENGECFLELVARDPQLWAGLVTEEIPAADAPARYATMLTDPPVAGVVLRW